MATIDKLFALAFAPSATEGEAINAFLALRRNPEAVSFYMKPQPKEKIKVTWELKLGVKFFDAWLKGMQDWKPGVPFFVIKKTQERAKILDSWNFEFIAHLDDAEDVRLFNEYMDVVFDNLRS